MAESIEVRSIQSLVDLRNVFLGFSHNVRTAIQAAEADIHHTWEHIHESEQQCQQAIQAAEQDLQQAQFALMHCQASGYTDSDGYRVEPDCTPYIQDVAEAQRRLRIAHENLHQVHYWKNQVAQAEQSYRAQIQRMQQLTEDDTDRARFFLDQKVAQLEQYIFFKSSGSQTFVDTVEVQAKHTSFGFHGRPGIQLVSIADLPEPEDISGSEDFKKISEVDMRIGLERWLEMKPIIESGVGASSDYWAAVDQARGLTGNGYQSVYDAFYGSFTPIRVVKVGNTYDIINGRHRIWLAKRMGIDQLPMEVVEKK